MLQQDMAVKLNEQLNLEFYSANLYLQMGAWCEVHSFTGAAKFLYQHAKEEMEHMQRLFGYLTDTGAMPLLDSIAAPPHQFSSLLEVFRLTYEHEQLITSKINELAHVALGSSDYSTFNFLQWYVAEQHEEEKLFKNIIEKIELVGESGRALFLIDKDLAEMSG